MDKYSRFLPLIISSVLIFAAIIGSYQTVWPLYEGNKTLQEELADAEAAYTKAEKDCGQAQGGDPAGASSAHDARSRPGEYAVRLYRPQRWCCR